MHEHKGIGKAQLEQSSNNKRKKKAFKLLFIKVLKSITIGAATTETT